MKQLPRRDVFNGTSPQTSLLVNGASMVFLDWETKFQCSLLNGNANLQFHHTLKTKTFRQATLVHVERKFEGKNLEGLQ